MQEKQSNNHQGWGIGVDIERIDRFKKLEYGKNDSFLRRVFTKAEIEYSFSYKDFAPHLAVRFCAKEAVRKALGGFFARPVDLRDVEVVLNSNGVPSIRIREDICEGIECLVSLSHTNDLAIAFVIAVYTYANAK
ncbi:MAG: holo-ACP synthase [Candidatus Wildermuthbacteria bacterium]|nr:holo-ACP synthase [Candidatus Wildermuthbacteria bacterium]